MTDAIMNVSSTLYAPLETPTSTRLLHLHPGETPSPLRCHLVTVDLNTNPTYEAISYAWASPLHQQDITINDTTVSIRENLHSFLLRFRDPVLEKVLWVDALSISQTDLDEKARQVAMIGRVFKQAARVRVWVGEHADGSELLFREKLESEKDAVLSRRTRYRILFRRLRNLLFGTAVIMGMAFGLLAGGLLSWKKGLGVGVPVGISIMLWYVALPVLVLMFYFPITKRELSFRTMPEWRAFVDRLYFRRLWIIQEIALAKSVTVHCGDHAMEWSNLIESRLGYDETVSSARDYAQVTPNHWRRSTDNNVVFLNILRQSVTKDAMKRPTDILDLVVEARHAECEDPRDRLYALLSMEDQKAASATDVEVIVPDYRINVAELFVNVYRKRVLYGKGNFRDVSKLIEGLKLTRHQAVEIWHVLNGRGEHLLFAGSYVLYRFRMTVVPASYEFNWST